MYYGLKFYYQQIIIALIKHLIVLILMLDWWRHLWEKYVISFKKAILVGNIFFKSTHAQ